MAGADRVLAARLAALARQLRQRVRAARRHDVALRRLHAACRAELVHDLDATAFADTFAQTYTFGLLAAQLSGRDNLWELHPFLAAFHDSCRTTAAALGGDAIAAALRGSDLAAAWRDFAAHYPEQDPAAYFYELFLQEYDAGARRRHGVFATPWPLVTYLVRAVDECLRTELGVSLGLADTTTWGERAVRPPQVQPGDPFVQVLDPATGTGTFLLAAIDLVHQRMRDHWRALGKASTEIARLWNEYVPRHLLPRLAGFELMPAAFAVAHLVIGRKLRATGYRGPAVRPCVYLANGLEPPRGDGARESRRADRYKATGVPTVLLGNPPYAALSANLTPACRAAVDAYRQMAGQPIRERGMLQFEKNLQDDYVKFLARAEQALRRAGAGIVGFVTNHSFLDSPTLRGLRWSLAQTFDRIRVLDLHGGANKRERAPDGGPDENVFAIRQGVAIALLRRTGDSTAELAQVERGDLWGTRAEKYRQLHADQLAVQTIRPEPPNYFFTPVEAADQVWEAAVPLPSVFARYSTGTETGFDALLLDFERPALLHKVHTFTDRARSAAELRQRFGIVAGHAAKLLAARQRFDTDGAERYCQALQFRPFDYRWAYLKKDLLKTNSFRVMQEISAERPGLIATRQTKECYGVFVTPGFCGHKCTSAYDRSYVFPSALAGQSGLAPEFQRLVEEVLGQTRDLFGGPVLFHYVYALLSAPSYRHRFGARLTREFPRVPLTTRPELLLQLAALGADLVALHLLKTSGHPGTALAGSGPPTVEPGYPRYEDGRILLSPKRWFEDVAAPVWEEHIGGYQVCARWLKDRRGRTLTRAEIAQYRQILHALGETRHIAARIDAALCAHGGWADAFSVQPRQPASR